MTLFQAAILGIVQGLTEFLPVSSSGHLVLVPHFLGWDLSGREAFVFDVLVQWGTLFAVFVYFRHDLAAITGHFVRCLVQGRPLADAEARLGWQIILATIPAVVAGLLFKDAIETAFDSARATGIFLLGTAGLLVVAETLGRRSRSMATLGWLDAWWIGCSQVLALLPGISRSGATIAGGMTRHLDREAAARFSFLMSVPVMLGAGILALRDLASLQSMDSMLLPLAVGFCTALVSGYLAIRWLLAYLMHHSLYGFAVYCLAAGVLAIMAG